MALILLIAMVQCKETKDVSADGKDGKAPQDDLDKEEKENKANEMLKKLQLKLHGSYIDSRPYNDFEKYTPYFFYLPLCIIYTIAMFFFGLKNVFKLLKMLFK